MPIRKFGYYARDKVKGFFLFCVPFIVAFFLTFKDTPDRAVKCMACSCLFGILFAIVGNTWKEQILPIICGVLLYLGTAGTFYLYAMSINALWCEVHYELIFAESLACMILFASKLTGRFRIFVSLLEWIVILLACAYIVYFLYFRVSVNSDVFFLLFQTNWTEVKNFVAYNIVYFIMGFVFSVVLFCCILHYNRSLNRCSNSSLAYFLSIVFMIFCIVWNYFVVFKEAHLYIHRDLNLAYGYFKQVSALAKRENDLVTIVTANKVDNIALIIGESANRDYMGCYGYNRQNTPWLSSLQKDENAVFFDHVYTAYRLTNKALAYFLTEKSQYNGKDLYSSLNIVDVMNAAGYDTYWISIQGSASNYREVYNVIAQRSKMTRFLEGAGGLDEKLLPYLDDIPVNNHKKFIVVHLLGSHHPYTFYPPKYNLYGEDTVNDRYDNTIAYTDFVLSEIYRKLSKYNPDLFIYVSDHGESKEMMRNKFDFRMTHVPFVVCFSDKFIHNNPEIYARALKRKHTYFTHDMFYDTLLDIVGMDKIFYDSRQSFLSEDYAYSRDNLKSEYGTVDIKDDSYDQ